MAHYKDYIWKEGVPYGRRQCDPSGITYKIPQDPYKRAISVEQYSNEQFVKIIYDSRMLNFRHLKPENQLAWEKRIISDHLAEIRDQDDRLLFTEEYHYEQNRCRLCIVRSCHGLILCRQILTYSDLGDPFTGVTLYDSDDRPVMTKRYDWDPESGLFTTLLDEDWQYAHLPRLVSNCS